MQVWVLSLLLVLLLLELLQAFLLSQTLTDFALISCHKLLLRHVPVICVRLTRRLACTITMFRRSSTFDAT